MVASSHLAPLTFIPFPDIRGLFPPYSTYLYSFPRQRWPLPILQHLPLFLSQTAAASSHSTPLTFILFPDNGDLFTLLSSPTFTTIFHFCLIINVLMFVQFLKSVLNQLSPPCSALLTSHQGVHHICKCYFRQLNLVNIVTLAYGGTDATSGGVKEK